MQVSWLRRTESGAELLTVGDSTYTGDVRYKKTPRISYLFFPILSQLRKEPNRMNKM